MFALIVCTCQNLATQTPGLCSFATLRKLNISKSMRLIATTKNVTTIPAVLTRRSRVLYHCLQLSMLHVATDYSISSIAGSLRHDQAIETYDMEGNL
jgi:hypothetical protein